MGALKNFLEWNDHLNGLIGNIIYLVLLCVFVVNKICENKNKIVEFTRKYDRQIPLLLARSLQILGIGMIIIGTSSITFEWLLQASRERLILLSICYAVVASSAWWMANAMLADKLD